MRRKKFTTTHLYGLVDSSRLNATPVEVVESGTVRMGLILEVIAKALEPYPEAREALCTAIAERLGGGTETRILP